MIGKGNIGRIFGALISIMVERVQFWIVFYVSNQKASIGEVLWDAAIAGGLAFATLLTLLLTPALLVLGEKAGQRVRALFGRDS